jgi:hypothetical protein
VSIERGLCLLITVITIVQGKRHCYDLLLQTTVY